MAEICLIYGRSGTGKSRSMLNFGKDEITLINVIGKRLPFKGGFTNTFCTDSIAQMWSILEGMKTKVAVIDDAGYIMTNQFMRGHRKGNQFDLYNDIADGFWQLLNRCRTKLADDVIVYLALHEETSDNTGETKIRTIGKLLNDKVCIEGMATICLRSVKEDGGYFFLTQNSGTDITKSPEGMFEEKEKNDLKLIDTKIREYYEMR